MKQLYILGMIIVLALMLCVGSELLRTEPTQIKEGFSQASSAITINMCPLWAPQIQTAKGNTDCCKGTLLDGKCSSTTFCSMSPPHDDIPSCIDAWKKYYKEKSETLCPPTIPNYFENVRDVSATKGCSVSAIAETGSTPTNPTATRCTIYTSELENRTKLDSCFIEKERIKIKCPPHPSSGFTSTVEKFSVFLNGTQQFGFFVCNYVNQMGARTACNDDKTVLSYWDRENANWRSDPNRYTQLEAISCNTFTQREAEKESERVRIEELRRRAEEQRIQAEKDAKAAAEAQRKAKEAADAAADKARRMFEDLRRRSDQQRIDLERQMEEMRNRLRRC